MIQHSNIPTAKLWPALLEEFFAFVLFAFASPTRANALEIISLFLAMVWSSPLGFEVGNALSMNTFNVVGKIVAVRKFLGLIEVTKDGYVIQNADVIGRTQL